MRIHHGGDARQRALVCTRPHAPLSQDGCCFLNMVFHIFKFLAIWGHHKAYIKIFPVFWSSKNQKKSHFPKKRCSWVVSGCETSLNVLGPMFHLVYRAESALGHI